MEPLHLWVRHVVAFRAANKTRVRVPKIGPPSKDRDHMYRAAPKLLNRPRLHIAPTTLPRPDIVPWVASAWQ